jgi:hypothetical protein
VDRRRATQQHAPREDKAPDSKIALAALSSTPRRSRADGRYAKARSPARKSSPNSRPTEEAPVHAPPIVSALTRGVRPLRLGLEDLRRWMSTAQQQQQDGGT